jgi:hypothetical protein
LATTELLREQIAVFVKHLAVCWFCCAPKIRHYSSRTLFHLESCLFCRLSVCYDLSSSTCCPSLCKCQQRSPGTAASPPKAMCEQRRSVRPFVPYSCMFQRRARHRAAAAVTKATHTHASPRRQLKEKSAKETEDA